MHTRFKKIIIGVFCTALLLCFCACTKQQSSGDLSVKDLTGKEFRFDGPLNKVVSTHNPTLNCLVILGNGTSKYIAGFGKKDHADALYRSILADWDSIEPIGTEGAPVNKETVVRLHPDLAIVSEHYSKFQQDDYGGTGIDTFVCLPTKESFESTTSSLEMLSHLFACEDRAKAVNDEFNKFLLKKDYTDKPSVLFMGPDKYSCANADMIQSEIINAAGGTNAAKKYNDRGLFCQLDPESIVAMNPEYIMIPAYAKYSVDDILNDPKLKSVNAIKSNRVFKFPGKLEPWDTPTPSVCLGVAWLTNILHPGEVQNLDEKAVSFYKTLYNKNFIPSDLF